MLDGCPVRAPNHRVRGCQARDTIGDFRLEITPEIRLRDHMYALQQTTEWKDRYKIRAGIEATNSELKRAHGIGRLRVRRIAKVCFAVACKLIACNIKRWVKAHLALKGTLQGCLSSLCLRVRLWSDLMSVLLSNKEIFSPVGTPSRWQFDRFRKGTYFSGINMSSTSPTPPPHRPCDQLQQETSSSWWIRVSPGLCEGQ